MSEIIDRPPAGWWPLDVLKADDSRRWDWVAIMTDVPADEFKHSRTARSVCVRLPGKHCSRQAAWDALLGIISTPGH